MNEMQSQLSIEKHPTGVTEYRLHGNLVGHIMPIRVTKITPTGYRAVNARNEVKHFDGLKAAQDWILSSYA